jgi:lactosylceramide 4-alpha-galactosyltransferase
MEIYFIFVTNSTGIDMQYSDLIESLMTYHNIHMRFLNPIEFSRGTLLEDFFHRNKLKDSNFPIEHMSDVLRVLLLNKYGGQYLDLDVLSLIPLSTANQVNFACPEDKNVVTNAVLNFDLEKGFEVSTLYAKYNKHL